LQTGPFATSLLSCMRSTVREIGTGHMEECLDADVVS
jgi:hypothetical protein